MNYTITRWETNNMLEETGDDIISFYVFLAINDQPELNIPILISFNKLQDHINTTSPEEYEYIAKVRNSIHGYGPKHSKVMAILEDEGYDFSRHIHSYITLQKVLAHNEYVQRINSSTEADKRNINEFLEIFENHSSKDDNIRYINFLDDIDKKLHELTVKYYPELFEMDEEVIESYKDELISATSRFAEAIDKLVSSGNN